MARKVRYNGGTQSYYSCSDPSKLTVGEEYEIRHIKDRGWQTDYALMGIVGEFNSAWFDDVRAYEKVFIAFSNKMPEIGKSYFCYKLECDAGRIRKIPCSTSPVMGFKHIADNMYQVTTCDNIYTVSVY